MKRTLLFTILAVVPAVLAPLSAVGQVNSDAKPVAEQSASGYRYTVYGGFSYTSLNQVNGSRYGLIGGKVSLTRNYGKYFGLTGAVDYNKPPLISSSNKNPGDPSVYTFMAAPELHATLYGKVEGLLFLEAGGEHTGGENQTPSISFAGGYGGGLQYNLGSRLGIRLEGDRIGASFSPINNSPLLGYSPHLTWNPRASFGVIYRF